MEGSMYPQDMDPGECWPPSLEPLLFFFPNESEMDGSYLRKVGHSASHLAWAQAMPGEGVGAFLPTSWHQQASSDCLP